MTINGSPNVSDFDFEVQLDISQPVPKAIITDISTYIGAGATNIIGIVVRIIAPTNLALPQTIYPPNVDIYPGLTSTEKNLPYFNNQVSWGNYKIYATLIDQDGTQYVWADEDGTTTFKSINLCRPNSLSNAVLNYGGLLLNVDPNCEQGQLIVQDGGTGFSYNGFSPSATEAALTITYPLDATGVTAQQTATFIPFKFPLTVAGIYSIQGTVTQTYQLTSTTSVKAAYYYQNTFDVQCAYSLCKALCDYEKLIEDIKNCSTGNPNQFNAKMRIFMLITGLLVKSIAFKNCGKKFGDLLEQFRIIGGFSCECDCAPIGIAPAPLFVGGGTFVKGAMCGDIDINFTQFMGNIQFTASDIHYDVLAAASQSSWLTITPVPGTCSMQFQISIDVCAMLGTVSLSCLSDVNVSSPPPQDGDTIQWNEEAQEWQAVSTTLPTLTWIDLTPTSGNWTVPVGSRLQYSKDFLGNVRLRGTITGTGLAAGVFYILATLPVGYRPSSTAGEIFITPATSGSIITAPSPAMISILDTGQIFLTLGLNGTWNLGMNCEFNVN